MSATDPRVAALAWELAARLELDRDLGIDHALRVAADVQDPDPDSGTVVPATSLPSPEAAPVPVQPGGRPDDGATAAVPAQPPPATAAPRGSPGQRPAGRPVGSRTALMPPVPPEPTDPELLTLREQALVCTRCGLAARRTNVAFGEGAVPSELMFIGEGPGREEDETGRPFVGPAGRLLTTIIEKGLGIPRSEVYIANIVKCRPPGNRDPLPDEVRACSDFLREQLRIVRPRIIVSVGKPSAHTMLNSTAAIGSLRGRWHDYHGTPLRVIYHPSYLLRERAANGNRHTEADRKTWDDLKAVTARLAELRSQ